MYDAAHRALHWAALFIAVQKLAKRKLIRNDRGTIMIIDRQGLEEAVRECYQVVNTAYNRLLGRGISRTFDTVTTTLSTVIFNLSSLLFNRKRSNQLFLAEQIYYNGRWSLSNARNH